jgi:hypothetical protein
LRNYYLKRGDLREKNVLLEKDLRELKEVRDSLREIYEREKNWDDYLGDESGGLWEMMGEEERRVCV